MAAIIPIRTYPSDFHVSTFTIHSPQHDKYPVLFTDREIVVDQIVLYVGDDPNSATNVKFVKAPAPNAPNYASSITNQADLTAAKQIPASGAPSIWTTGTTAGFTINTANNQVASGYGIWMLLEANFQGVSQNVGVQVRWRSQY
jgi:hypothetical protein